MENLTTIMEDFKVKMKYLKKTSQLDDFSTYLKNKKHGETYALPCNYKTIAMTTYGGL